MRSINFDIQFPLHIDGGIFDALVTGSAIVSEDNYGEDIDGKRGVPQYLCSDIEIDSITIESEPDVFQDVPFSKVKNTSTMYKKIQLVCIEQYASDKG